MSRATVEEVDDTKLMQEHRHSLFADEQQQKNEHVHPYGFTAVPQKPTGTGKLRMAAEAFMSFMGSGRSHGVAMLVGDRRYRLYKLAGGEVALHDDQGQQVHFKRDGIWASAPNSKKIVMQVMDDDTMPQESGAKGGQIKQAGRAAAVNFTLDRNALVVNHPVKISFVVGGTEVELTTGHLNLKSGAVHTVGSTHLGVDAKNETATPISPDINLNPSKQTFVKIA